jgi:DNA repair protein RadC
MDLFADYNQIPLIDAPLPERIEKIKKSKHRVAETLGKIEQLYHTLNTQLASNPTERPTIHSPKDAFDILQYFLSNLDHEEFWVVNMDTRNRIKNLTRLYVGSVNSSTIRVGEVFRQAIIDSSPAILLAHNHPSGDPAPSPEDVNVTRAIKEAGKLLDIDVLDHIVIGGVKHISLKERGLGF